MRELVLVADQRLSRRNLLVSAATLALLAQAMGPLAPPASAAAPTLAYGHGYTGGY